MTKRSAFLLIGLLAFTATNSFSQTTIPGESIITPDLLYNHISFIASPLMEGRDNGKKGLEIAQLYISTQASLLGLKPGNGDSYLQPYPIIETSFDEANTKIKISSSSEASKIIDEPIYQISPSVPSDLSITGEVVFAGYGMKQMVYDYNDYDGIDVSGKIVIIMDGVPTSPDGKKPLFEGNDWTVQYAALSAKLSYARFSGAKAVIIVPNPKYGSSTIEESYPGLTNQFRVSRRLKNSTPSSSRYTQDVTPVLFSNRSLIDELLAGTRYTLEELQAKIDDKLKPYTFIIPDKQLSIDKPIISEEKNLNNVAAIIEGSDPELKNEYVVFSCHADHIGVSETGINLGADDNASGCAGLLSIAKAFQESGKRPKRSILFLWVSGEEIGLYGSQSYVDDPLVPLEKTVVDLNIDMIGRSKGIADTSVNNPMSEENSVFVITGNQSSELLELAQNIDDKSNINFDYSLSGRDHPQQLFSRSDHYNFVKNDIPVLFFFTGIHTDYHTPGDTIDKLNFDKMTNITKAIYKIGYTIANQKNRLIVDNPFSSWE